MALVELQQALRATDFDAEIRGEFVVFPFPVPAGAHAGETVKIGLTGPDFPINPPGGVHVSPRITHPMGNNHNSGLGAEWIYWSRPFSYWAETSRSIGDYLAFVRQLFAQFAAAA